MKIKVNKSKVAIVMGSQSDYSTMKFCKKILKILQIKSESKIISAHRTPLRMYAFAKNAEKNNISVIIAGAGGSAHLPGMIASLISRSVMANVGCSPAVDIFALPAVRVVGFVRLLEL